MNTDCVFCKIIAGDIPARRIRENEHVLVIEDIAPKAPVHYLVIPKVHLKSMHNITYEHKEFLWQILIMGRDLAKNLSGSQAFNFISNNGADAGQSVFHMHWHFVSGAKLKDLGRGQL